MSRAATLSACVLVSACAVPACRKGSAAEQRHQRVQSSQPPLSGRLVPTAFADSGDGWPMATRDYTNTRYSPLAEIGTSNVRALKQAWSFDTGFRRGQEAAPIVALNKLFVVMPYPNVVFAFDLERPGPALAWRYEPRPEPAAQGVACCDVVNRGAAYADGRLFFNTLDDHTIALDAQTGRELWKTKLGDVGRGETMTMAPTVIRKHVFVGNSGGELGVRGWLTALDTETGAIVWRAYSTGPDSDVLIGRDFLPYYAQDRGKDLGVTSWPPGKWEIGGGTVWGFLSYDPELDLLYYGTSNPGPWNPELRPGDNRWTSGIFARRPDDGQARWAYQWSPHDLYDHDGNNEAMLLDLEQEGSRRKVLVHPDRNGYVYVVDRATGQVLAARSFVHTTTSEKVDLTSGRLVPVREKQPGSGRTVREICPSSPGGKDWQPAAFSKETGWIYLPRNNLCQDEEGTEANYIAGTPYLGANVRMYAGPGGHRGELTAWDPVKGRAVWSVEERFPVWSGALATAGGLVFYGTMEGAFKALDVHTGAELWRFQASSGIIGQPVTFRGPDGKQYIAVLSGVGGWAGAVVSQNLDPRDATAALGFVGAMGDLKTATRPGGTLHVFTL